MPKLIQIPKGQKWLISRAKGLGYKSNDGGVCFGFANVAMYYFFMQPGKNNRFAHFNAMLENIHTWPIDTLKKVENNKGTQLLGIKGFFEGIEVFQQPYLYSGVFNGKPPVQSTQGTVEIIFPESNFESCGQMTGCYSKTELKDYLISLGEQLKEAKEPVYLLLNAAKHAIAISYDPANTEQPWTYIDANTGKAVNLSIDKMANQIFSGVTFNKKPAFGNENYAIFSTEIFAYSESQKKVQDAVNSWKSTKTYENLHTPTDKKLTRRDIWGKGWLYAAAKKGNEAEVSNMLQVADTNNRRIEEYDNTDNLSFSVLDVAAERGNLNIAKLLVNYATEHPQNAESLDSETDSEIDSDYESESDSEEDDKDISPYHFLLHAAKNGHHEFIKEFFDENALIDLLDKGPNLFHTAAKNGHRNVIEALFKRLEELKVDSEIIDKYINQQDDKGRCFLHIATANNHGNIITFSMDYNESHLDSKINLRINLQDESGLTFIERAVMLKGTENTVLAAIPETLVEFEIENNPKLQRIIALGGLADAITNKSDNLDDILKKILEKNQPENKVNNELSEDDAEEYFIEDLITDGDGNTALHIAVQVGDIDVVKRILKAIPDAILEKNDNKQTPLHLACQQGNLEIVKILLEESDYKPKKVLFKRDDNHDTALHLACKEGHGDIVSWLLEQCPEKYRQELIERENYSGQNLLHIAAFKGLSDVVKTILAVEEDAEDLNQTLVNTMDDFGQTVLHYAVLSGNTETVGLILNEDRIKLINKSDDDDVGPLLLAITQNDKNMVRFILEKLEEVDDKNIRFYSKSKGMEPLLAFAVAGNHFDAVTVLVEELQNAGKDIDELPLGTASEFQKPLTPLAIAIDMGHTECAKYLLKNGANINKALNNLTLHSDDNIEKLISYHRKAGNEDMAVFLEEQQQKNQKATPMPVTTPVSIPVTAPLPTPATTENDDSVLTKISNFFTTPSMGRSVLIGIGMGLVVVGVLAFIIGTNGIGAGIIAAGATAGLSATATVSIMATIAAAIIGAFATISAVTHAASEPKPDQNKDLSNNKELSGTRDLSSISANEEFNHSFNTINTLMPPKTDSKRIFNQEKALHSEKTRNVTPEITPDITPEEIPEHTSPGFGSRGQG